MLQKLYFFLYKVVSQAYPLGFKVVEVCNPETVIVLVLFRCLKIASFYFASLAMT